VGSALSILSTKEISEMLRKIALILLAGLYSMPLFSQNQHQAFEIFGGYSYVRASNAVSPFLLAGESRPPVFPNRSGRDVDSHGWEASIAYRISHLGLVVDSSGHYGSAQTLSSCEAIALPCKRVPSRVDLTLQNYVLAGPRFYLGNTESRFDPFVHALFGYAHYDAHFASSAGNAASGGGYAMALGGGADIKLIRHLSYRLFQTDYFLSRFNKNTQNNLRVSTGLVVHF